MHVFCVCMRVHMYIYRCTQRLGKDINGPLSLSPVLRLGALSKSGIHILLAGLELKILRILQSLISAVTTGFVRMPSVLLGYWLRSVLRPSRL